MNGLIEPAGLPRAMLVACHAKSTGSRPRIGSPTHGESRREPRDGRHPSLTIRWSLGDGYRPSIGLVARSPAALLSSRWVSAIDSVRIDEVGAARAGIDGPSPSPCLVAHTYPAHASPTLIATA